VSTFRLEPEHFILTTGTFNLIVKDRIAFRLSGALSVRTEPLTGSRTSSKPFNRIVSRELLSTLCNHRISTCFAQRGAAIQARETQARRTLYRQRDDALPLANAGLIRHVPTRKTVNTFKDRWEVLLFAKPFRNLVPECEPRDSGSIGGFLYSMPESLERFRQTRTPRQSSSDLKFIAERQKLCKGESRMSLEPTKPRRRGTNRRVLKRPKSTVPPGTIMQFVCDFRP